MFEAMSGAHNLDHLLEANRRWAAQIRRDTPEFFKKLSEQQNPKYLWIGCSDSRVPANQIVDLLPGELFVHRNVANLVIHTDLNCLSVMQFAVDVLKVECIIVCGHYRCGGVQAALQNRPLGLIDNWLRHIQDVGLKHASHLAGADCDAARWDRLCELNVIEQVHNACQTTVVRNAWERGQPLSVHGMVYGLNDGVLRDLNFQVDGEAGILPAYRAALAAYPAAGG